jgi:bacterioferritin-associated ferredoxin
MILRIHRKFGAGAETMIVCICRGLTDRRVREEAAAARSLDELFERTGAGSSCGLCKLAVARIAAAEQARLAQAAVVAPALTAA